jgi:hypothetical protein
LAALTTVGAPKIIRNQSFIVNKGLNVKDNDMKSNYTKEINDEKSLKVV